MTTPTFERRVEALFGDRLEEPAGVVHVASAIETQSGELATLRIGKGTPTSATDGFVLDLARARADAIVTTGQILRDEPMLRLLPGPDSTRWRRERIGKLDPPLLLVLSTGRALPPQHPIFGCGAEVIVFIGSAGAAQLERARFPDPPEICAVRTPGLRAAIDFLRRRGARSISIEAGASTSANLYNDPLAVDELLLSVFEGALASNMRAGALPSLPQLRRLLPAGPPPFELQEPSGSWRFHRLLRASRS
jgi:riboflavin biosynthesis pyrimidine reductase